MLMRTCAVVLLVGLLLPAPASAQVRGRQLGFRAGVVVAHLSSDEIVDPESRTGFTFGAFLGLPLSSVVSLEPGLSYAQKGAKYSEDDFSVTLQLDYVEIPFLLRFDLPSSGSVGAHVRAGPVVSLETSCSVKASAPQASLSFDCDANELDEDAIETKSLDLGALVGGGLTLAVASRVDLLLDVSYDFGLTDINDSGSTNDVKNRALTVTVGVAFPIGG